MEIQRQFVANFMRKFRTSRDILYFLPITREHHLNALEFSSMTIELPSPLRVSLKNLRSLMKCSKVPIKETFTKDLMGIQRKFFTNSMRMSRTSRDILYFLRITREYHLNALEFSSMTLEHPRTLQLPLKNLRSLTKYLTVPIKETFTKKFNGNSTEILYKFYENVTYFS